MKIIKFYFFFSFLHICCCQVELTTKEGNGSVIQTTTGQMINITSFNNSGISATVVELESGETSEYSTRASSITGLLSKEPAITNGQDKAWLTVIYQSTVTSLEPVGYEDSSSGVAYLSTGYITGETPIEQDSVGQDDMGTGLATSAVETELMNFDEYQLSSSSDEGNPRTTLSNGHETTTNMFHCNPDTSESHRTPNVSESYRTPDPSDSHRTPDPLELAQKSYQHVKKVADEIHTVFTYIRNKWNQFKVWGVSMIVGGLIGICITLICLWFSYKKRPNVTPVLPFTT